uniref:JmjC domain-containing protein n=1 Tax=Echinococcus granulosus TaxID=6210 RepID=A0A068WXC1_ECHGR|nr:hypothetical protein EgrG_002028900 [Echinococcus granulosus]
MINIRVPDDLVQVCHINNSAFTTTLLSNLSHGTNPQRFRPMDLKLLSVFPSTYSYLCQFFFIQLSNTSLKSDEGNQWNTVTIALFLDIHVKKEAKNQMNGQPVHPLDVFRFSYLYPGTYVVSRAMEEDNCMMLMPRGALHYGSVRPKPIPPICLRSLANLD